MQSKIILLLLLVVSSITARGQEFLEMLKHDINAERRAIVAEAMTLPIGTETEFWQIYTDMEAKLGALTDKRAENIQKFADNYEGLTDDVANDIVMAYYDQHINRFKIYKSTYKKLTKVLSKVEAARFIQIIDQIQLLLDVQVAAEVPLIK